VRRAGVHARLAGWVDGRSPRERALLGLGAALVAASLVAGGGLELRDQLRAARARVTAHERELAHVRRLAALVTRVRAEAPAVTMNGDARSLPSLLEAAAGDVVGRERIASMTPAAGGDGEARVTLRIAGASLDEAVRLVHSVESTAGPIGVARLGLEKHVDDAQRFDLQLEVRAPAPDATAGEAPAGGEPE